MPEMLLVSRGDLSKEERDLSVAHLPHIYYSCKQMPGCCGIHVIHEVKWIFPLHAMHHKFYRAFLNNAQARAEKWAEFVDHLRKHHGKCAKFMVSDACSRDPTNPEKMSIEEMCTVTRGWRASHYMKNPNSGNYIRTWEYFLVEAFPDASQLVYPEEPDWDDDFSDDDGPF